MKAITAKMKNAGKVQVILSAGRNSEKFSVTNRIDWKPKKVIDLYLRRWDIETIFTQIMIIG